jgi:1,4-dihydroxy-2-naphthoate octaprenyltransferase
LVQVWLVASGRLPVLSLISLLALIPALKAGQVLSAHAAEPAKLAPAVQMTILAAHLQPVLLSAALVWTLLA